MAKVVARKETGKLVIDFTFRGVRCREQTALADTVSNRKLLKPIVDKLKKATQDGSFNYKEFFPGSRLASRFDSIDVVEQRPTKFAVAQTAVAVAVADAVSSSAPVQPSNPGPLFKTFANQWVDEHSIEWRRSHIKSLTSTLNGRLTPYFGNMGVGSISKADILAFRATLAKAPGRGGKAGLSPKRINEIMGLLRQILTEAADRFGFTSPVANIKKLRQPKTDVDPFSLVDVQRILATVRSDYTPYFTVRFFTGMRTGEVHGLKWKYVDFDLRIIRIRETFVLGEDDYTKTDGSQRDIQMSQPVYDALKAQFEVTGKLDGYVFCNLQGHPLDNKNFSDRVWYPLLRHLDLKKRRPYQMRHTAATLWLASGEAPEWIARQLGHTTTEMLFRTYSRYVPNLTRQDGSAMERLLASKLATGALARVESSPVPGAVGQPTQGDIYVPVSEVAPQQTPKTRGITGSRKLNMSSCQDIVVPSFAPEPLSPGFSVPSWSQGSPTMRLLL